jgi:hypothetical protein
MMPGACVEEQKRGREDRRIPVKKARLFGKSDNTFRFMGDMLSKDTNDAPRYIYWKVSKRETSYRGL